MLKRCYSIAVHSYFLIIGLFLFPALLAAEGDKTPTLIFNSASEDPLSNSMNSGFIDQLLHIAAARSGFNIKRVQLPAERALRDVNSGKLDGEFIRVDGMEKKYPNLIKVDEKIMDLDFVVFSRQIIDTAKGWESLEPYNVTFLSGWKIIESNIPANTRITKVNLPQQLFHMLYKKRTDAIIYERWAGLNILTNDPRYHGIKIRMPPLATRPMYCYLNKNHADLVDILAQSLKEIKRDGTYKKLYDTTLYHLAE